MKLYIKNIGMIKEAEVKLNGLTVIAGENETGKSTVGKTLFAIIKSAEMTRGGFFYTVRNKNIFVKLNEFKTTMKFIANSKNEYEQNARIINLLENDIKKIVDERLNDYERKKKCNEIFTKYKNDIGENVKELFYKLQLDIEDMFTQKYKNEFRKGNFQKIIEYLFDSDIVNKESEESSIIIEDLLKKTEITLSNNEVVYFKDGGKFFKDATYIDSPVIFQIIDLLNDDDLASKEYMPTIKDLKRKLTGLAYRINDFELEKKYKDLLSDIVHIINGEIVQNGGKFEFKKNGINYSIKNTATGIKSFGILMILLKKKWILNNSVLILDEPEVHLHPKWQLKYAQIIVKFVQIGINVLVTSHSPYMIEALKKISELYKLEDKTNFYLAHQNKVEQIENSNSLTLEKIFEKLSAPFEEFDKIDEEIAKNG